MSAPLTTQTPPPTFVDKPRTFRSRVDGLLSDAWLVGGLAVLLIVFAIAAPGSFLSAFNLTSILTAASLIVIMAVGQTFVIATAGVDLSLGGVLVFAGVASATVMSWFGGADAGWGAILLGLVVALVAAVAWGLLNGFLIAVAGLPPLIVTLGTFGAALSLAQVITGGLDLRDVPRTLVQTVGSGQIAGIPVMVVVALVVVIVGAFLANSTRFGVRTKAIGSNSEGARRAGIPVTTHLVRVYAFQGLLVGLAAFISLARYSSTTINGHSNDALAAIAGVVLGGTSLFGGSAKVVGTVIGVLIPVILLNGLVIVGLQPFWQGVAVGAVLILAVYIDQLKRKRQRR
jgi:ribose transport system permease protein